MRLTETVCAPSALTNDRHTHGVLKNLGPLAQWRAGRLRRRLPQLLLGLVLYGVALAFFIRADLGLNPWSALYFGLAEVCGGSIGLWTVLVNLALLPLWFVFRQKPGIGTVLNALLVGSVLDVTLLWLPVASGLAIQCGYLALGVLGVGVAGGLYLGTHFGPGPKDGVMTGLVAATGFSVRRVRTALELTVLALGWALGAPIGVGTVVFAVLVGPILNRSLALFNVKLSPSN